MRRHVKREYTKINEDYSKQKKSRFRGWLYRLLFLLLLILFLWMFGHFNLAIEHLARLTTEQSNLIHMMDGKIHSLELDNANLNIQNEYLKIKINGLQLHNLQQAAIQQPKIVNVPNDIHNELYKLNPSLKPTSFIATTTIAIFSVLKQLVSLSPVMP